MTLPPPRDCTCPACSDGKALAKTQGADEERARIVELLRNPPQELSRDISADLEPIAAVLRAVADWLGENPPAP